MHIPDGYMSLQTSVPAFGAMIPIWSVAAGKVRKFAGGRQVPLLSLCSAFSFVIMMFNIPVGPSSVHAVGAVFAAVLMGPWAASIAVSVALVIQALVFGDGGVLSLGLNCFNMAFAMPFVGYGIYRIFSGRSGISSKRSLTGIFLGSYAGINIAALLTAVEFGIQPLLFRNSAGVPEYGFFPLSVSVPALMTGHLLVAGPAEAVITVFAVAYLARFSPQIFSRFQGAGGIQGAETLMAGVQGTGLQGTGLQEGLLLEEKSFFSKYKAFIIGLAVLTAAVPLGLLASGKAWGEWGKGELKGMIGFIPSGMERLSGVWSSLFPDYRIKGLGGSFAAEAAGYIISAAAGVLLIAAVMLISGRIVVKKKSRNKVTAVSSLNNIDSSKNNTDSCKDNTGTSKDNTGSYKAKPGVPAWLLEKGGIEDTAGGAGSGAEFFKKTAVKVSRAFQEDLLAERYASKGRLMQGVDPRIKLVSLIALMVITGMTPSIPAMFVLLAAAVMLVILSGLDILPYVRRVWLVLPLLLLIFSVPAATNLVIGGIPVFMIAGGHSSFAVLLNAHRGIYFTLEGVAAVTRLFLRMGVSISFGYILIMTTRWSNLVASLRSLKLPAVIAGILGMTYRYIFVLIQVSQEMFEARYLRTVGRISNRENRRFLSGRIALLFVKSGSMSEEIYDSMLCRCYSGEASGYGSYKPSKYDFLWLVNFVVIIFVAILFW